MSGLRQPALVSDEAALRLRPSGFDQAQDVPKLSDVELAGHLMPGVAEDEALAAVAQLSAVHRETLERLIWAADELNAGRVPPGVIL